MEIAAAYANFAPLLKHILPTVACIFSNIDLDSKNYDGHKVIRVDLLDKTAYDIVNKLYLKDSFDFYRPPSRKDGADFMVCPEQVNNVKTILKYLKIPYKIVVDDVQSAIDLDKRRNTQTRLASELDWNGYHRLSTILKWMDNQVKSYPDLVRVENYGKSSENRVLKVLVINTNREAPRKPAIWIDSGSHAREWITPAVATYVANALIQAAVLRDRDNYNLVDAFEWYIVPTLNPDGYEYSHTVDRLWSKTRSVVDNKNYLKKQFANLFGAAGVDIVRNWDYKWGKGVSKNPISVNYVGVRAASEPEVKLTQDYILKRKDLFKNGVYLSLNSYSQKIVTSLVKDVDIVDDNENNVIVDNNVDNDVIVNDDDVVNIAKDVVKVIRNRYGTKYDVVSSADLLNVGGQSIDWAKAVVGIKYSYNVLLRDTGRHNFLLPVDQIIPTGEEAFLAIKTIAENVVLNNRKANGNTRMQNSFTPKNITV